VAQRAVQVALFSTSVFSLEVAVTVIVDESPSAALSEIPTVSVTVLSSFLATSAIDEGSVRLQPRVSVALRV
jgi:hypothetical protein